MSLITQDDFLAAICATPDDDLPRLVYADWLDGHDEPKRAEFIRVQIELHRLTGGESSRIVDGEFGTWDEWPEGARVLWNRCWELWRHQPAEYDITPHDDPRFRQLFIFSAWRDWIRGFPGSAFFRNLADFVAIEKRLRAKVPVEEVRLKEWSVVTPADWEVWLPTAIDPDVYHHTGYPGLRFVLPPQVTEAISHAGVELGYNYEAGRQVQIDLTPDQSPD